MYMYMYTWLQLFAQKLFSFPKKKYYVIMPYIQVLLPIIHYRITTDQHYIVQFQEITIISSQFKKKRRLKQI